MIETEAVVKEWGNSLGIVLPSKLRKDERIKSGDKVKVIIIKDNNILKESFGALRDWKLNAQELKDKLRKEWSKR